jgi:hypothetical protein
MLTVRKYKQQHVQCQTHAARTLCYRDVLSKQRIRNIITDTLDENELEGRISDENEGRELDTN